MNIFGSYIEALDILASCYMGETNPWSKDALKRAMKRIELELEREEQQFSSAFAEYHLVELSPDMELK